MTAINNLTTPSLLTWSGQANEYGLDNIAENDGIITFNVVNGDGTSPAHGFDVGDVNHDGSVTIKDVTALIDYLLGSGDVCMICADVNVDGSVTIKDVTNLIDMLLLLGGNR